MARKQWLPASGRSFSIPGVTVVLREHGKIVRESLYYDMEVVRHKFGQFGPSTRVAQPRLHGDRGRPGSRASGLLSGPAGSGGQPSRRRPSPESNEHELSA